MKFLFTLALFILAMSWQGQTYNYYFGNLHSHTGFSDGNKDSSASGVGRPDGSYAYAKLSNNFDFLGISEHNHYSSAHNPGFKKPLYQTGLNMADAANDEGNFLALFGLEYGVSSNYNGHIILYGFNQLIGWETSVPGVTGSNFDIYNAKTDYAGFFTKVKNNPNAFCYLAHPGFSDYTLDGNAGTSLAYGSYNATFDSAIVGLPLRSGLAFSTDTNYNDYSSGNYFDYFKRLLYVGYHLGIGYDHDNHYTNFGRSNGGRLVILAQSLTRANLYNAMQQMHFYGSDDSNTKVEFTMNNNIMGSVLSASTFPTFNVVHNDPDGENADSIKIWRGFKGNPSGIWAEVVYTVKNSNTAAYTDNSITGGQEYYYFAEIKQKDGQWIVTSPIWYTIGGPLGVKENAAALKVTMFQNRVTRELSVAVPEKDEYSFACRDVSGRTVISEKLRGENFVFDLNNLNPGVYLFEVRGTSGVYIKKILVE